MESLKKKCSKCREIKDLEYFHRDSVGQFGVKSKCKECLSKYNKEFKRKNKDKYREMRKEYIKNNPDKVKSWKSQSKESMNKYATEYRKRILEKEKIGREIKVCYKCKREKNIEEFRKDKYTVDGYTYDCKQCNRESVKEYRKNNREKVLERNRINNKKRSENPFYRIKKNISRSISQVLEKNKEERKNRRKSLNYLPFTIDNLKKHLEKQFKNGMSWRNYGEWHIDHIIPQSYYNYNSMDCDEFRECWKLENLQPLWAFENMSKGSKILEEYKDRVIKKGE